MHLRSEAPFEKMLMRSLGGSTETLIETYPETYLEILFTFSPETYQEATRRLLGGR